MVAIEISFATGGPCLCRARTLDQDCDELAYPRQPLANWREREDASAAFLHPCSVELAVVVRNGAPRPRSVTKATLRLR